MRSIEELIGRQIHRWNSITEILKYVPGEQPGKAAPAEPGSVRHPPICISRELGSGARVICRHLCQRLGYEMFGRSLIDEIAKDLNVQRQLVDYLDEHGRSELELLIESYMRGREIESREYLGSLIRVVKTLGRGGGVVLLGRGATFILREQAALNVLVVAPLELRVKRLMDYLQITEKDARAQALAYDQMREHFVRKFFGADVHNPSNFDLVINTARIPPEQGGEVVLQALKARGYSLEAMAMPDPLAGDVLLSGRSGS